MFSKNQKSKTKIDYFIQPLYGNTLPDVPFDEKHLAIQAQAKNFPFTAEELKPFYDQMPSWEAGITVDMVGSVFNWEVQSPMKEKKMHPIDEMLLDMNVDEDNKIKRKSAHNKKVPWLRRTEYISSEATKFKTKQGDQLEFRLDKVIKWKRERIPDPNSAEFEATADVIKLIEKGFEDAQLPIINHFSKKGVVAVEIIPLFPDDDLFKLV